MPKDMKTHKPHKDETVAFYIHKMASPRWQGQKLFYLIPQFVTKFGDKHRQKEREKKQWNVSVKIEVVSVYDRKMVRVDKMFQNLASFLILMRYCAKAYKVLLF
jgi:hypothetical protein